MPPLPETKINRFSIAVRDFENARKYLAALERHTMPSVEHEALLLAAIIAYWRPFSPNEKGKAPKADPSLTIADFGDLTPAQIELHETLKQIRNKGLAHSEFEFNPTQFNPRSGVYSGRTFSVVDQNINLALFASTLKLFEDICHGRRASHSRNARSE